MAKFKLLNLTTRCDSTCMVCAKEFWNWLKSRNAQMSMSLDGGTSFASAAATSASAFSGYSTSQQCDTKSHGTTNNQ